MSVMSTAEEWATRFLHEAVKKQYAIQVSGLLSTPNGVDVNLRDGYGMTALMWAAGRGYHEIASILLHKGADTEARNELLSVHSIEQLDHLEPISRSSSANEDRLGMLHVKKRHGWTALIWAARNGRTEIVNLLLDSGANVNAITKDGFTALVHAIDNKHQETAHLLLERGANPNLVEDNCSPAISLAASYGFADLVQAIIDRGGNVKGLDNWGHTALENSVAKNQPEILRLLLRHGFHANSLGRDDINIPPLHIAAAQDALECAQILLDQGAEIDAKDELNGVTALMFALDEISGPRVARLLIERGADIQDALDKAKYWRGSAEGDEIAEADEIIELLKKRTENVAGS